MANEWLIVWVLAVIFLATLIRSAFGFGEALVAVPLLALLMPVEEAVPLGYPRLDRRRHNRRRPGLAQDSRPQCRVARALNPLRHPLGPVAADGGYGIGRQGD